jgi:hypothetical protein
MDFETDDPEKGQLLQKSAQHRTILEEEVKLISERTEKIITSALVVGGALALTYFLVSRLSESREKPKSKARKIKLVQSTDESDTAVETTHEPQEAGIVSQIGAALMAQATTFLLSVAKEKLSEFLEAQAVKKGQNNNEHPH